MNAKANNFRYIKASKLHFVFLMILIGLLFFRTLAAQDTTAHRERGFKQPPARSISSGLVSDKNDSTSKGAYSNSYWFDMGLGWGGQGGAFDIGFSYEVAPQRVMSIRYSSVRTSERFYEYFLLMPTGSYPSGQDAGAIEITYGVLLKGKEGLINFTAGLSFVKVKSGISHGPPTGYDIIIASSNVPDDYQLVESNTVGVVMRAQVIPSVRWGGIGISPSVNINKEYTFASLTIQLALGKMRAKARKAKA